MSLVRHASRLIRGKFCFSEPDIKVYENRLQRWTRLPQVGQIHALCTMQHFIPVFAKSFR